MKATGFRRGNFQGNHGPGQICIISARLGLTDGKVYGGAERLVMKFDIDVPMALSDHADDLKYKYQHVRPIRHNCIMVSSSMIDNIK